MTKKFFSFLFIFLFIFIINIGSVFADDCSVCGAKDISTEHVCSNNELLVGGSVGANGEEGSYTVTIGILKNEQEVNTGASILDKYRTIISILAGVSTLTMLLFFVLNFVKLAKSSDNPQQRQSAMIGIIFTGCGTVLLGGVMAFFTFFYNFI